MGTVKGIRKLATFIKRSKTLQKLGQHRAPVEEPTNGHRRNVYSLPHDLLKVLLPDNYFYLSDNILIPRIPSQEEFLLRHCDYRSNLNLRPQQPNLTKWR